MNTAAPMGMVIKPGIRMYKSIQITEAENGFVLSWYSEKNGGHTTYVCLNMADVSTKLTELFEEK